VVSSTSPDQNKKIYLDPALLERVQHRRVVIVDDVLNTGGTMSAVIRLLQRAHARPVRIVVVLTEGWQWHRALSRLDPAMPTLVQALGHIPIFARAASGWVPIPDTGADGRPAG
jgi:adenine/guanine phosphoribosyltransferase-like PRPP-binding protein